MSKIKVLYIVGVERSGSTIFQNVISQIKDFFAVGEIRFIWDQAYLERRPCGCGSPIQECPVWSSILTDTFGDTVETSVDFMANENQKVRDRFSPLILIPGSRFLLRNTRRSYLSNIEHLYRTISEETSARVIVDASKSLFYAYMLSLLPSIDLYVVHLVRDVRGVEYSLLKRKATGHPRLQNHHTSQGALTWLLLNSCIELLGRTVTSQMMRVRYEDFVADPRQQIKNVLTFINEVDVDMPVDKEGNVELEPTHTIVGSPSRFRTGKIRLELDTLWQELLPFSKKLLVSTLTFPLLLRYKYRLI